MSQTISPYQHASQICDVFQLIKNINMDSFEAPNMALYERFMALLSNQQDEKFASQVLAEPCLSTIKSDIASLFAAASGRYEHYWAQKVLASTAPILTLESDYPWFSHYQRAVGLESNAIYALSGKQNLNVLMAGSGPLPITSMLLSQQGMKVSNLDIDAQALTVGERVQKHVYPQQNQKFSCADICEFEDLEQFDVVWLAALAGSSDVKRQILSHLFTRMRAGSFVVVRTAFNLRQLLYPSIELSDLMPFTPKLKIQTYSDNFHSILIAQKPLEEQP